VTVIIIEERSAWVAKLTTAESDIHEVASAAEHDSLVAVDAYPRPIPKIVKLADPVMAVFVFRLPEMEGREIEKLSVIVSD